MNYTINTHGRLTDLAVPRVMGILNATPDSFYTGSRCTTARDIAGRARQIIAQGADIVDIGACSTRPGSTPASQAEEMERLRLALGTVRSELPPATVISVDTFRPDVARMAVEEYGADIINDVGAHDADADPMFRMVSRLGVPYILMSSAPDVASMLITFARQVQQLRDLGQKDIVLDPGFGFGKTVEQNFRVLSELDRLSVMELPVLAGLSRKSMIFKTLDITADDALNGTTALHAIALMKGASILRVHDVRQAVECVTLYRRLTAAKEV